MGEPKRRDNLQISEIFKSLQGEGQLQGTITTFVRFAGCNLRCNWCDTPYARHEGESMQIEAIVEKVKSMSCLNICITGGEPLLQENIQGLFDALKELDGYLAVETNGTRDIGGYKNVDRFIVDYKLKSGAPSEPFCADNLKQLRSTDELKFVVFDLADYEEAKAFIRNAQTQATIVFSPCWNGEIANNLAGWILEDDLPVRYSLQIHKLLGLR